MPSLKPSVDRRKLKKELTPYDPGENSHKSKTKERFYRRLKEQAMTIDKEVVFEDRELLEELAGTPRIHEWLKDSQFARWWWDEYDIIDELMALRGAATNTLKSLLTDKNVSDSDKIKSIRLLFEVTDQFPSKKKEYRFLDEKLNNMEEDEADAELLRLQNKLNTSSRESDKGVIDAG